MRDYLDGSRLSFGHCTNGEPTGDESLLNWDEPNQCTACGWLTPDPLSAGLCLDCVDDLAAAVPVPAAPVYVLHPTTTAPRRAA